MLAPRTTYWYSPTLGMFHSIVICLWMSITSPATSFSEFSPKPKIWIVFVSGIREIWYTSGVCTCMYVETSCTVVS